MLPLLVVRIQLWSGTVLYAAWCDQKKEKIETWELFAGWFIELLGSFHCFRWLNNSEDIQILDVEALGKAGPWFQPGMKVEQVGIFLLRCLVGNYVCFWTCHLSQFKTHSASLTSLVEAWSLSFHFTLPDLPIDFLTADFCFTWFQTV